MSEWIRFRSISSSAFLTFTNIYFFFLFKLILYVQLLYPSVFMNKKNSINLIMAESFICYKMFEMLIKA